MRFGTRLPTASNYYNKEVSLNEILLILANHFGSTGLPTSVGSGRRSSTSVGTAIALSTSSAPCKYVMVSAALGNSNPIVVGDSNVIAANGATQRGCILIPGNDVVRFDIDDVSSLFFDVQTSGDSVVFAYFN